MDRLARLGLAAVAVFVALSVWAVVDVRRDEDLDTTPRSPAEELVDAWRRSRTATYRAAGTFERTGAGGARMRNAVELVQRPPDRVLRQFDEVTGHRGDRASFEDLVAREMQAFRSLVEGPDPLYRVTRTDPACWRMRRTRNDPRGGFGLDAEICVDRPTGAIRRITIDHGTVDERTVYDEITAEVTDEHLEP